MIYIFYNPLSNSGRAKDDIEKLREKLQQEIRLVDVTVEDKTSVYNNLTSEDEIIISGGDGTLHEFVNAIYDCQKGIPIRYYKTGTGNDFAKDVSDSNQKFIDLNPYIENLPEVCINGEERYFLNGVGFGLDGFCCEYADDLRAKSKKKINYSLIGLQGLLYAYKNKNAKVIVDGKEYTFTNVLMAPVMNGRYYGGGVKIAPDQDRLDPDNKLTIVVVHNLSKLRALPIFPRIYSGNHVKYSKYITVLRGHSITVEYDSPAPVQIDGETVRNVLRCEIKKM